MSTPPAPSAITEPPALDLDMDIDALRARAHAFRQQLDEVKRGISGVTPYPYDTFGNLIHLERLLTGERRKLGRLAAGLPIADVAAADGDLAFFLEAHGFDMHIVDNAAINCNGLRMARAVAAKIGSRIDVHDVDLDSHFTLPQREYGLVLFLGVLYHLKNPFYALEQIARQSRHMALSTRVAQFAHPIAAGSPAMMTRIDGMPLAYLVDDRECNDDPTNYWIFTHDGLKRLLRRAGWEILDYLAVGNTQRSDPATAAGDERAFCLARSRVFGRT